MDLTDWLDSGPQRLLLWVGLSVLLYLLLSAVVRWDIARRRRARRRRRR